VRSTLAALTASLLLTACSLERASTGPAPTLHDLTKVSQLQTAFNQDRGHPRLIVLLSPT
jgi:hypothetical protein